MAQHHIDQQQTTRFLTAIGDPRRLQILFALGSRRMNVGEITTQLAISRPAVSHHLKILREADVLLSVKIGQEVFYWINTDHIVTTLRSLADEVAKMSGTEAD
ncbi:MAG: winged helix-turn-helix transcriptional regulator [Chloroflexi bacterium]|nr:winged helix-turn-helix transcriptional regulator [Chloroflexota bacterium]